jgi:hypothetical protein
MTFERARRIRQWADYSHAFRLPQDRSESSVGEIWIVPAKAEAAEQATTGQPEPPGEEVCHEQPGSNVPGSLRARHRTNHSLPNLRHVADKMRKSEARLVSYEKCDERCEKRCRTGMMGPSP